jgi:hypothetical protein
MKAILKTGFLLLCIAIRTQVACATNAELWEGIELSGNRSSWPHVLNFTYSVGGSFYKQIDYRSTNEWFDLSVMPSENGSTCVVRLWEPGDEDLDYVPSGTHTLDKSKTIAFSGPFSANNQSVLGAPEVDGESKILSFSEGDGLSVAPFGLSLRLQPAGWRFDCKSLEFRTTEGKAECVGRFVMIAETQKTPSFAVVWSQPLP